MSAGAGMGHQTDFNNTITQLEADATAFNNYETNAANEKAAILTKISSCTNVYEMIALIYASISPGLEASEAPYGAAEKIGADLQRCTNDIHDIINIPDSVSKGNTTLVTYVYEDSQALVNLLTPPTTQPTTPTEQSLIESAIGSTTNQTLVNNFQAINNTIWYGSGSTQPADTIWDGTGDPLTADPIQTFYRLRVDMGLPGDPNGANHIYHTYVNSNNTISSTLSTQTNVANTNLKMLGSEDKQWLSFGNDMIQMFEGVMKAAQQHAQNAGG